MTKEEKDRWLEALRSAQYEQAQCVLHNETGFCCLGVLCDVSGKGRWEYRDRDDCLSFVTPSEHGEASNYQYLPQSLRDAYGLGFSDLHHLMGMNDAGKTFAEIADWIEEHL